MEDARKHVAAAIAAALVLAAPAGRAEEPLRGSGTGTALGAMRRLATAFARASPGDALDVRPSVGSGGAFKAVAAGALDLGFAGRELSPQESELGLMALPYARTPFVFVAGPRSGVSGITEREAAAIYRGDMAAWPGGERIRLILRPRSDADTLLLRAISPEMEDAVDRSSKREGMLVAATNQECNDMVERTPGALAPSSLTQLVSEAGTATRLAWNGVAPTLANLASGAYPLEKRLWIVIRARPRPAVRRFLAFLGSPEGRRILEEAGNLPVALGALP